MLIKVLNRHNDMILVNADHITKVRPYDIQGDKGIVIRFANGESEEMIPDMTVEEFLIKATTDNVGFGQMTTAICDRISHLEDAMAAGLQYIGRSCH